MSDQPPSTNGDQLPGKKKDIGTKGLHRLPIKKALELAKAVYELGENDPVPRGLALDHIHRAAKSGSSDTLVGASNTYGLTKSVRERLQITELGKIIVDNSSSDLEKRKAVYDALFSNEVFASTLSRFADKVISSDKQVTLYLTQTLGLTESDAKVFWDITKQNIDEYGLTQELTSGGRMILSRERAEANLRGEPNSDTSQIKDEDTEPEKPAISSEPLIKNPPITQTIGTLAPMSPEFHFNIQIHLPPDAKPEQYDAIFKSIGTYLLGRKEE